MPAPGIAGRSGSPLVSVRGAILAALGAVALAWPMLILSAPLIYPDAIKYINQGHELVRPLLDPLLSRDTPQGSDRAYVPSETLRSAPYAGYLYLASRWPLGPVVPALVQAAAVLFLLGALVKRELEAPPAAVALAALGCCVLTSLPWFASYLMPDILAAAAILYAAVLVRSFESLDLGKRLALGTIATFATVSHYGHIPLAAASTGAALLILLARRRLTWAVGIAGAAPIVFALVLNAALGWLAYDGPSAAPRRLPVMLARSIADGPARWYLEGHCADERYAICEVFEEFPDNVWDVLWGDEGLNRVATPEQIARIRAEEPEILRRALKAYPLHQVRAFLHNVAIQIVSLGTKDFWWASIGYSEAGALRVDYDRNRLRPLLDNFGTLHTASALAGLIALAWLVRPGGPILQDREAEVAAVVAVGLLSNALIFGGLSAPADRYQSRIAWLLPAIAALFWLEQRRRSAEEKKARQGRLRGGADNDKPS